MNGDVEVVRTEDNESEVFVQVTFEDDTFGILNHAKWLSPKEMITYRASESEETLESIMSKYYLVSKKSAEAAASVVPE